jgi:hypothetical protein
MLYRVATSSALMFIGLEILFADTHSESCVKASDDEDYFEEEVRAQKVFWDLDSP